MRRLSLVLAMSCVIGLAAPASVDPASVAPASVATAASVLCTLNPTFAVAQVIWVDGSGSNQTTRLCARVSPGRYVVQKGPYAGHVGVNGVAAPGAKREGDGKTPYGAYPMRWGFGTYANPGLASSWLVTTSRDVWVDDAGSSLYNTHQRTPVNGRWRSAEAMRVSPAYNYTQVIGYNERRTPGRGSAIFLHVDTGSDGSDGSDGSGGRATIGCVSLPTSSLLAVLRWQKPGAWIWITQ